MWDQFINLLKEFWESTGIARLFMEGGYLNLIMILLAILLLYLAIFKKAEPYLLIPIAFGMLLVNLPGSPVYEVTTNADTMYTVQGLASYAGISFEQSSWIFTELLNGKTEASLQEIVNAISAIHYDTNPAFSSLFTIEEFTTLKGLVISSKEYTGLLGVLYLGVKYEIYPCLIFLGIGATTDFGPLISNPKTMILGAAAQIGIFVTFLGALLLGFDPKVAASIGIIGGADGPTAIYLTNNLAPQFLSTIAIVAYSYMALVPFIQPPIIRALTTKKERQIKMQELKPVSQTKKILFPIIVSVIVILLIPSCAPLIGCLMLGNLIKESKVVPNLVEACGKTILYAVTIILGLCVGATASADTFLTWQTIKIFILGIVAFSIATASGVLIGKLMCKLSKGKINPMIGAAGVSAVPMAARVVHKEGVKEDPSNFLLMHAMGPNVAGVIGSAVAAGLLLLLFG